MILTSLQSEKIQEIVSHFNNGNRYVDFKAPTGSGKTLMATGVISKMINTNPDKKMIFIIATISSSDLPEQFERKINEYKGDLEFNDFTVEYIQSPSSGKSAKTPKDMQVQIRPEQNKVYIFGKASFGKGRIITEQKIIDSFVQECKQQGYTICYIRDEAHIGTRIQKKDIATFETLMADYADFILKMTATLDFKKTDTKKVELSESDLKNPDKNDDKWLIKTRFERLFNDSLENEDLLDNAIQKFKIIKNEYSKLDFLIRPAMLIQVDNEPTEEEKKLPFIDTINLIKKKLSEAGLSWVKYFGNPDKESSNVDNDKFTLEKISRNNDTTDCIIFKIGPATGWDIPRACMLLQLRNVCSSNLHIQTIGRIKRNPYPNLKQNSITDKYYLFSNQPNGKIESHSFCEYELKNDFQKEEFASIIIQKDRDFFDVERAKQEVVKFLNEKQHDILVKAKESFRETEYVNTEKKIIVKSPILLLKMIKTMEDALTGYQKKVFSIIKSEYLKTELKRLKYQSLEIILISHFMEHIKNIIQRCFKSDVRYKLDFRPIDPKIYSEITSDNNQADKTVPKNYLFNLKRNGNVEEKLYLSSGNENVVFDKIKSYMEFRPLQLKVWAKNQERGNVYGEYFDENKFIRHSFFDFILKFNNGNLLYIEVKGNDDSDINRKKTDLLKAAYADYFKNKMADLFHQKIVICLARVEGDNIFPDVFCDKSVIPLLEHISFSELLIQIGSNS